MEDCVRRSLRGLAIGLSIVYGLWNIVWLAQGEIPPAIFKSLTGLPAPTTGGTRALRALLAGQGHESLRWNALAVPLGALYLVTVGWLFAAWVSRRTLRIPAWFLPLWIGLLLAAWALKLAGDPARW